MCATWEMTLEPGAKFVDHVLLNSAHEISAPGVYVVEADRPLVRRFGPAPSTSVSRSATRDTVHQRLEFRVDANLKFDPSQLLQEIDFTDVSVTSDARLALATLAPRSLEDTLIARFTAGKLGSVAMERLNTPRSIAALAESLRAAQPGSSESTARFLGKTGDPQWLPLLLEKGHLEAAAESGGDQAVPFLIDLMHSDKQVTRQQALRALGYTGSRAAVPVLLDLLQSPDNDTAQRAAYGLRQLTHRTAGAAKTPPQSQYTAWHGWWSQNSQSARIYKGNECGDFVLLP